jgi:uncharacterized protein
VRLVLDTNVLIAAFVARGHCHELLEHVVRAHELFTSAHILEELREKLTGKLRVPAGAADEAVELALSRMRLVEPEPLPEPVCRDPDDDLVLATALAARAHALVTGDGDLLTLKEYRKIGIVSPAAFWRLEAALEHGASGGD